MLSTGLRRVWPIHFQRLCLISCSNGVWHVHCHNRLLLMISGHVIPRIILRQLLTKVCWIYCGPLYLCSIKKNSLDICIENHDLVLRRKDVGFQNILPLRNGRPCLASPILALTLASVALCVSTTLPDTWNGQPLQSLPRPMWLRLYWICSLWGSFVYG